MTKDKDPNINAERNPRIDGNINTSDNKSGRQDPNDPSESNVKEVKRHFSSILVEIDGRLDLDENDKSDLEHDIDGFCKELAKKDKADIDSINHILRNMNRLAPDILESILTIITNPDSELGIAADKIVEKFRTLPKDKSVSILGLKQAGKSTFIGVLDLALTLADSPWKIRPVGKTIKLLSTLMYYLFEKGEYPPPTTIENVMEFVVEKEAAILGFKPGIQFRLHAADVPGEAVMGVSGDSEIYNFYEKYLKGCDGIIFLLDYKEQWLEGKKIDKNNTDVYLRLFTSILAEIREQVNAYPYVVFCVTKADQIDEQGPNSQFDKEGYFDGVEKEAEKILGRNTKFKIDQTFDSDHIFWLPVSATGFTGEGEKRTSQFFEKTNSDKTLAASIRNPNELKPIGVAEALEWILDNLAGEDEDIRIRKTRGKKYSDIVTKIRKFLKI